jgi:hypothetical protein
MSRNLDFRSETFQPYAKALGELTLAWNDFHMALSSVFWAASKIPNKMTPQAMWNAIKSDRAQRDMLEALIDLRVLGHNLPTNIRCEIKWVLHEARKLEDTRNDALHSPLLSEKGTVFAWYQLGHARAEKLANKDLLKVFGWFYDTVIILRQYTELLSDAIGQPNEPLPKRPSLPNRGDSK